MVVSKEVGSPVVGLSVGTMVSGEGVRVLLIGTTEGLLVTLGPLVGGLVSFMDRAAVGVELHLPNL